MGELTRRSFVAAALAASCCGSAKAQNPPLAATRVALKGYDPVSYFTEGKPEKGSSQFTFAFDDSTYWFKSAEHRARFVADPERYAPQFAGYCAIQVSRGAKGLDNCRRQALRFLSENGCADVRATVRQHCREGQRELAGSSHRPIRR